jgi:hypothetical protein
METAVPASRGSRKPAKPRASATADVADGGSVYQLRVTLLGTRPPVWRRIVVPAKASAEFLHQVIQMSMGWTDSHLHQFILGKRPNYVYVMPPDPEGDFDRDIPSLDAYHVTVAQLMERGEGRVVYEYDFGDSWEHEVRLEKDMPMEPGMQVPTCLDGARACPPEDCGGIGGYEDIVKMVADPKFEPENGPREELMEWLGGEYDPEAFNLGEVNGLLSPPKRSRARRK